MRDYVEICENLRKEGTPAALAGAEALKELQSIAQRMVALGVDLEAQIQDDLTPDLYVAGTEGITFTWTAEELADLRLAVPNNVPFKLTALKMIGDSWFVFLEGDEAPREFYSQDAALAATAQQEK